MFHVLAHPPVPPRGVAPPMAQPGMQGAPQSAPPQAAPAPQAATPTQGAPQAATLGQPPAAGNGIGEMLRDRARALTPQDNQTFEAGITVPALLVLKKLIPEIGPAIDQLIAKKGGAGGAPAAGSPPAPAAPGAAQPAQIAGAPPPFTPRQPVTQLGRTG